MEERYPVACNELKKNFEKKIKAAIGNQSDMNAKEHIAYLNALLGNPTLVPMKKAV